MLFLIAAEVECLLSILANCRLGLDTIERSSVLP